MDQNLKCTLHTLFVNHPIIIQHINDYLISITSLAYSKVIQQISSVKEIIFDSLNEMKYNR